MIPATRGLGVEYENVHAPNESIALSSLLPIYDIYRQAVLRWTEVLL
jgi:acetylornithine deacetylase/succinyl-diaminopimelate desuccinylase-like protein